MRRRQQLRNQTRELLVGLGNNRAEVAASLCDAGVWGARHNPRSCAVSSYLNALLGADPRVRSHTTGQSQVKIVLDGPVRFFPSTVVRVPLPQPVRQFIVAFDRGMYPMLVRAPAEDARQSSESTAS